MKFLIITILAGVAAAFVIPNEPLNSQILLNRNTRIQDATQAWWESIPGEDTLFSSFEETVSAGFENGPLSLFDPSSISTQWGGGHHGDPTKTIYDLIKESKYTKKFSDLVDEYDDIKVLLQDIETNRTLFVPTDRAFDHIPDHHKKPPKEFILAVLKYHIVPGLYPAHRVISSHTLPTSLDVHALGNHSQRLRIRNGLFKVYVNFFSKIVASDIAAKNGVIHAVDSILIPPPSQEKIIQLIPSKFSTFRLAMEITELGEDLNKREKEEPNRNGGTLFAPTNRAFARLGPRANAFLFSDYGKKYLRALLKYHIVVNETLYSDAFYEKPRREGDGDVEEGWRPDDDGSLLERESKRIDLPSLLEEKPISVEISQWKGFVHMKVNGRVPVVVQDGLARDGVIQVVGFYLFSLSPLK